MAEIILLRKTRSALRILLRKLKVIYYRCTFIFWGTKISIGKNTTFGDGVKFKTTDGGRIVIGEDVAIDDYVIITAIQGVIVIGDNSYIGVGSHIVAMDEIKIGDGALIAAYCVIRDMNHGTAFDSPMYKQKHATNPVYIGNDVWLGAHVVVTAGSKIGDHCVIGANAVVTHEIPFGKLAVGLPAKPIRNRQ